MAKQEEKQNTQKQYNKKALKKSSKKDEKSLLLPRTKAKLIKMEDVASKIDEQKMNASLSQSKNKEQQTMSPKTQDLGVKDKEYQDKNKKVEGILKKAYPNIQACSKNGQIGIKANVIAKKQDVKIIANKHVITFSIVLLVLLLISLVANFVSYSMFKLEMENPPITITRLMTVQLKNNENAFVSITVPRNILPNSNLEQKVNVYTLLLDDVMVVRSKGMFTTGDGDVFDLKLTYTDDWLDGGDGYFYYKKLVQTSDNFLSVEKLNIPEKLNTKQNGKSLHVATIIFETLNYDVSLITQLWTDVPQEWLNNLH